MGLQTMSDSRMPLLAAVPLLALICGCGGPLDDARAQFDQGHYAIAKQVLNGIDARRTTVPDHATYALYRGLTYGALGDLPRASTWLREARDVVDAHPGALDVDDEHRLRAALQSYEVSP
jgi:hypothetical protein